MPRKPLKKLKKIPLLADWEIAFMKNGPPEYEKQRTSPHKFAYLDGRPIWERLNNEPDFNPNDFPWGAWAYTNKTAIR